METRIRFLFQVSIWKIKKIYRICKFFYRHVNSTCICCTRKTQCNCFCIQSMFLEADAFLVEGLDIHNTGNVTIPHICCAFIPPQGCTQTHTHAIHAYSTYGLCRLVYVNATLLHVLHIINIYHSIWFLCSSMFRIYVIWSNMPSCFLKNIFSFYSYDTVKKKKRRKKNVCGNPFNLIS